MVRIQHQIHLRRAGITALALSFIAGCGGGSEVAAPMERALAVSATGAAARAANSKHWRALDESRIDDKAVYAFADETGVVSAQATALATGETAAQLPATDAARFLVQATYGPHMRDIEHLAAVGYDAWLSEQFAELSIDTHWDYVKRMGPMGCETYGCDSRYINAVMESFWKQAVEGRDQLRQRMTQALAEIFVVSTVNSAVDTQPEAHAAYLDMLSRNAFGNFRDLLEGVTRSPAMGIYLSHIKNEKEDPVTGRIPDENYAREVMQLFTIGLWQLNPDGTRKTDGTGQPIPTYGMEDVMGLAKVFTGLSWGGNDRSESRFQGYLDRPWSLPMQMYDGHHSTSEKKFLGTTIAAGAGNGDADIKQALDTLFNHPNVGPFIGSQLIKRFVTSNPSPAYVARVAAAFDGGGAYVRGDMKNVIRAVLMDPEARDTAKLQDPTWGKLREPIVRLGGFLRAFDVKSSSGVYRIWNLEDPVSSLGQNPQRSPSVFNWFRPDYAPPGEILDAGLTAPEFQITHETTVTGYANYLDSLVERTLPRYAGTSIFSRVADYSPVQALADDPDAMLDYLNTVLLAGQMTPAMRSKVKSAVLLYPVTGYWPYREYRPVAAIRLLMASPEFIVQK